MPHNAGLAQTRRMITFALATLETLVDGFVPDLLVESHVGSGVLISVQPAWPLGVHSERLSNITYRQASR